MLHMKTVSITRGTEMLTPVVFGALHSWPDADFSYQLNNFNLWQEPSVTAQGSARARVSYRPYA